MADALESLNGLIVPLAEQPLLLPNVAVAELVGYRLTQPAEQGPDWFLGWTRWREQQVPLIDPERLLQQESLTTERPAPRVLVLNALGRHAGLGFIGLRVYGIPRSRKVLRGEIETAGPASTYVQQPVHLAEESQALLIPDLLAIEQALVEAGLVNARA